MYAGAHGQDHWSKQQHLKLWVKGLKPMANTYTLKKLWSIFYINWKKNCFLQAVWNLLKITLKIFLNNYSKTVGGKRHLVKYSIFALFVLASDKRIIEV